MKDFLKNNGLSVVFFLLFVVAIIGQAVTGHHVYNAELEEKGGSVVSFAQYLSSGHFIQSTFENWESEFLQMALFVVMAKFLYQKGSSESKDPEGKMEEVDRAPNPRRRNAPAIIKKGGVLLKIYEHSLSISLYLLFAVSFYLHWMGSLRDHNLQQSLQGKPAEDAFSYLVQQRFWFESFQNWQSEFLSVFAIVVLSIYLREKSSPQSKPVDAPHMQTG